MSQEFDVLGIGNAIVDVLAKVDDDFLAKQEIAKGGMTLVSEDQAKALYDAMPPAVEISGGSAANTIAGIANLGGKCAFIGKVHNDQLGKVFQHDIHSLDVTFPTTAAEDGLATARCMVLVTPDAQRSMSTFLGACTSLTEDDIDPTLVAASKVTYLEGYLWDPEAAKAALRKAIKLAHEANKEVALTLSDSFCVGRHRAEFLELIEDGVDIFFANEDEIKSLYEVETFEAALDKVKARGKIAAFTRSEKGAVIVKGNDVYEVSAADVDAVVDTTGAGDLFAAGFLAGYTAGKPLDVCGKMGAVCAAEIISHVGARPEDDLKSRMSKAGLA